MVEIAARPQVIESPSVTADQITWGSYQEVADAAGLDTNGDPVVFQNERGEWVRWCSRHDPGQKTLINGVLHNTVVEFQRRVALTAGDARVNGWDFYYAVPGQPIYGRAGIWMRNGVKPETDPALWYAQQTPTAPRAVNERRHYEATPAAEAAAWLESQQNEKRSTANAQVVTVADPPVPPGRKGT